LLAQLVPATLYMQKLFLPFLSPLWVLAFRIRIATKLPNQANLRNSQC
jgi:hypothetical protein